MELFSVVALHLTAIALTILLVATPTWLLFECGMPRSGSGDQTEGQIPRKSAA